MGKRRSVKSRNKRSVDPIINELNYELNKSDIETIKKEYELKEAELKRRYEEDLQAATDKAFLMMLHFPLEVLLTEYWPRANKSKIEKYINCVIKLYEEYNAGSVDLNDIKKHIEDFGGITITSDCL
jgi:hypothetical protein